jgi:Porin-like glycoporin RafY
MKFNKTNVLRATCAAALLALGGSAFALDFNANIELDSTYRKGGAYIVGGAKVGRLDANDKGLTQSGRVELNANGKAGKDMFVAGKASFLAKKDGTAATDDMWVQVGNASGDVKLGRFEAADLFPLPGDTVVENAAPVYAANALRGRKGSNVFHVAGTGNLGSGLSVELGLLETKLAGENKGVRPAISYANGPLSLRLGFESGKYVVAAPAVANKINGFGATAGYDFGGFKLTGNYASGKGNSATNNKQNAFALIGSAGPANLGFITAKNELAGPDEKINTLYGSYTLPLFDIKGASITPAASVSKATIGNASRRAGAVRVRINYAF